MNLLNQRCKVERAVITKNAQMQTVKTWKTINNSMKCNIQYGTISQNSFKQADSGQKTMGEYIGFFDKEPTLLKGDKITWYGITLFVDGVPSPVFASGNSIHHFEAALSVEES